MSKLNELEQLKKEYKEIPIPENGVAGVQTAIEKARQKKRLKKRLINYASIAAAAVMVVVVMPSAFIGLFAAGGAANESAPDGYYNESKDMIHAGTAAEDSDYGKTEAPTSQTGQTKPTRAPGDVVAPESVTDSESVKGDAIPSVDVECFASGILSDKSVQDKISAEITRQISFRRAAGEEAFVAMMEVSSGCYFDIGKQKCYQNAEGQLVIVFKAGELAPEIYGDIEFVIPDEVWK